MPHPARCAAFLTAALAAAVSPVRAQSFDEVFEWRDLAPGVHAALVRPRPEAYAFANALVVVGEGGVLVVDTQQSSTAAAALVDEVRRRIALPVRWVVNTHWHADHVYGNQAWADAFPGARFVAHEATREAMRTEGRAALAEEIEGLPATIAQREAWLETGRGPDGTPLDDRSREAVAYSVRLRRAYLGDLRSLRWVDPDVTFTDRLSVDLGGRRVDLVHPGPGHTAGDVVVHVPDAGVVAAGDLIEAAAPWIEGADLHGWARSLAELSALSAEVVLPAHGSPDGGVELLVWQSRFFAAAVAAADGAVAAGEGADGAQRRFDPEPFRESFAGVGLAGEDFEAYWREAVAQAAAEARR